ncbi:MAG: GNAT family N-acetyltransferase [Lachnospira sp.]
MKVSIITESGNISGCVSDRLRISGVDCVNFDITTWNNLRQESVINNDFDVIISDCGDVPGVDIGLGEAYRGCATFIVYEPEDITFSLVNKVYCRKNKMPITIFETERLIVREMTVDDLDACYEMYDTLKDCPYIEQLYERAEEEEFTRKYIENMYGFFDYGLWLCFIKETGELVARIGIENRTIDGENVQELGYLVSFGWQGKGIAYEVCTGVLDYARDILELPCIYSCINKENIPSINLSTKLGFRLVAECADGMNIYKKNLL